MRSLVRTNKEITEVYERNVDTVYRVCFLFFHGNRADTEDAVQTTFLRLAQEPKPFRDAEHEKAWLIVTAGNICRDMLSSGWRRRVVMDEQLIERSTAPFEMDETLQSVMALPDNDKTAIYLFYYEGYSAKEIAGYMGKSVASVWGYLHSGRSLLRTMLKEGEGR